MVEYKDMHWSGNSLYHGSRDTTVKLTEDENNEGFYRIEWNFDKLEKSVDIYNLDRASDNARVLYMRYKNGIAENASA